MMLFVLCVIAECVVDVGCCSLEAFVVGAVVFLDFGVEERFVVIIQ